MNQNMTTSISKESRSLGWRGLSVTLVIVSALALMMPVAFAGSGGDLSTASRTPWTIRAGANPDMNVGQWYATSPASSASSAPWSSPRSEFYAALYAPPADSSASSAPWPGPRSEFYAALYAPPADSSASWPGPWSEFYAALYAPPADSQVCATSC